jgi:hypothetical protein
VPSRGKLMPRHRLLAVAALVAVVVALMVVFDFI